MRHGLLRRRQLLDLVMSNIGGSRPEREHLLCGNLIIEVLESRFSMGDTQCRACRAALACRHVKAPCRDGLRERRHGYCGRQMRDRSPHGAKRNAGSLTRITLRSIRATVYSHAPRNDVIGGTKNAMSRLKLAYAICVLLVD